MNGFEKRTAEKKAIILQAAFKMINSDEGVAALNMDQLAKEAKVGKSTIFKYFGNKENVITAVYTDYLAHLSQGAYQILEKNLGFEETFIELSQQKITFLNETTNQFYLDLMAFLTAQPTDGELTKLKTYSQISLKLMIDLFHQGRIEGKVDLKYSDEFLMMYFNALISGIASPEIYEHAVPYTKEWTAVFLNGIAPKNA